MVKIFVGNLNPGSKSNDLRKRFELYGKVTECDVVNNYAFVHMENEGDAEAAIAKLHNSDFDGVKINVEMSHGKRGGVGAGGPMRKRFNDRGPRRDFNDDRMAPPRSPYEREGHRGMAGMGGYQPMRDNRCDGPSSWGGSGYSPCPPRGPPRGYDGYGSPPGRYPPREYDRSVRSGPRDAPYGGGYQNSNPEPVPSPRDLPRKQSPPRGRYEGYGDNYDRYRDHAPHPQPRPDYYDGYTGGHDYAPRDYRENDRGSNYDSYDYGYYGNRGGNRSPPRPGQPYGYGRP